MFASTYRILAVLVVAIAVVVGGTFGVQRLFSAPPGLTGTSRAESGPVGPGLDIAALLEDAADDFPPAEGAWSYRFPADHGAHSDYHSESWSFSGQLHAVDDPERRFAFQLLVLRLALSPKAPQSPSAWATREIYRAHFAITDQAEGQMQAFERFSRAALGLAGAEPDPPRVWVEHWEVAVDPQSDATAFHLTAHQQDTGLELTLTAAKPPVYDDGTGSGEGLGGLYGYAFPRLKVMGTLTLEGQGVAVAGEGWLDRSWGALPLNRSQVATDRFLLQLDDGRELSLIQFHRRDGSGIPRTTGVLIDAQGSVELLRSQDVKLIKDGRFQSAIDGAVYPARWQLTLPYRDLSLAVTPLVADQELDLSLRYWSGAVTVEGHLGEAPIGGTGHVQLTGYSSDPLAL
ncbi:MAG: lipocalin-like domain-containing protein [Candidatus Competibacterales bacterium]